MKNIYTACLAAILCLCSCSKFEQMSENPYALYDAPAESYVQPIVFNTEYALVQRARDVMAEIMQYSVNRSTEVTSQMNYNYSITESIANSIWQSLYIQAGNAQMMLEKAKTEDNPAMEGVALILKTMLLSTITDTYGNVPYFDACKLPLPGEIVYVTKYDSQVDIYKDMFLSLERANQQFLKAKQAVSDGVIGTDNFSAMCDLMYNGEVEKWRRFGNTLYLRLLMRSAMKVMEETGGVLYIPDAENPDDEFPEIYVTEKIAEIYDSYLSGEGDYPVMRDREDAALVGFSKTNSALYTPFYSTTPGIWNAYVACKTLIDKMSGDPRLNYYFTRAAGAPPQLKLSELNDFIENNKLGNYPRGTSGQVGNLQEADHYALMNYSEMLFIFAEAGIREWIGVSFPDVREIYKAAVKESVLEWNTAITEASPVLTTFLDTIYEDMNSSEDALEKILTQKWISTFWVGIESWCDYRRTGYPTIRTDGPAAENNKILPTRMRYPADEKYRNEKSYMEALEWLGGDNNMQTDVWWADTNESRYLRLQHRR